MSDNSEDMEIGSCEYDWQNETRQEEIDRYLKRKLWRTGSGQLISFDDMSNDHKLNVIKFCNNNNLIPPNFGV